MLFHTICKEANTSKKKVGKKIRISGCCPRDVRLVYMVTQRLLVDLSVVGTEEENIYPPWAKKISDGLLLIE